MSSILDALKKLEEDKAKAARAVNSGELDPIEAAQELTGKNISPERLTLRLTPRTLVVGALLFSAVVVALSVGLSMLVLRPRMQPSSTSLAQSTVTIDTAARQSPRETIASPASSDIAPTPGESDDANEADAAVIGLPAPSTAPAASASTSNTPSVASAPNPSAARSSTREAGFSIPETPSSLTHVGEAGVTPPFSQQVTPAKYGTQQPPPPAASKGLPASHETRSSEAAVTITEEVPVDASAALPERQEETAPRPMEIVPAAPTQSRPAPTALAADVVPQKSSVKSIYDYPLLTPSVMSRYSLNGMRINMLSPLSEFNRYPSAVINNHKIYVGDRIKLEINGQTQNTRARLVDVAKDGVAIEITGTNDVYFVKY